MKVRKNRLTLLAILAGAAYFLNKEAKKNPELVKDVKKQWDNVKTEVGKVVNETKSQASQVMSEFEQETGDYTGDAFEAADELKDAVKETASNVQDTTADVAEDLKKQWEEGTETIEDKLQENRMDL